MKKRIKRKSSLASPQIEQDITGSINKLQQQLISIEKKIDDLISRSSIRLVAANNPSRPAQQPAQPRRYDEIKQENRFRERTLHKAVCADCHKECEVPFKPSGDRPVYCKECFSKRKNGSAFNAKPDSKPERGDIIWIGRSDKRHAAEDQKPAAKKKSGVRPRKKRA